MSFRCGASFIFDEWFFWHGYYARDVDMDVDFRWDVNE